MNEMKIQVNSKDDVHFVSQQLQQDVRKLLSQQLFESPGEKETLQRYLQQMLKKTFEDVHCNTQVAGYDWDDTAPEEADQYEPFDEKLFKELQQLQTQLDDQLVTVAKCRREMPPQMSAFIQKIQDLRDQQLNQVEFVSKENRDQNSMPNNTSYQLKPTDIAFLNNVVDTHQRNSDLLNDLKKSLPLVVEKMRRIKQVLEDKPKMDQSTTEKILREDFSNLYGS